MLKCKEVTQLVASGEIDQAAWPKRLELRLHLLMCRYCRLYAAQLRKLGDLARRAWGPGTVDPATLQRIEQRVLQELARGPDPLSGGSGSPDGSG